MPVELLPGESRQLDVQMVPRVGPPHSSPIFQSLMVGDMRYDLNATYFMIYCKIFNEGQEAGTHTVTSYRLLHGLASPQLFQDTETFTIEPGETRIYYVPDSWITNAKAEVWVSGDWGEETPRLEINLGYLFPDDSGCSLTAVHRGADRATLRYSQRGNCDRWELGYRTPRDAPYDDGGNHDLHIWRARPSEYYWQNMSFLCWPLLSGRSYYAHCSGRRSGGSSCNTNTTFSTL